MGLQWRSSGPSCSRSNHFGSRVLLTLGTLTINQIINMIKESEIDELSVSLNRSRISYVLASHQANISVDNEKAAN